jgi:hypothetical protein
VSGHRHLLLVLALLQAALGLLAALGQLLFTGANPAYLVAPLGRAALVITAAAAAASGRRWGPVAIVVLEGLSVAGLWISAMVGLLPWVDNTVNLVGLLSNLVLPAAMLYLAARLLATRVPGTRAPVHWPAPPVTPVPVPVRPAPTLFLPTRYGDEVPW